MFQMSHLDGKPSERLICATCVKRLREALDFRRQVLQCEEAFLQMRMYDAKEEGETMLYFSSCCVLKMFLSLNK